MRIREGIDPNQADINEMAEAIKRFIRLYNHYENEYSQFYELDSLANLIRFYGRDFKGTGDMINAVSSLSEKDIKGIFNEIRANIIRVINYEIEVATSSIEVLPSIWLDLSLINTFKINSSDFNWHF